MSYYCTGPIVRQLASYPDYPKIPGTYEARLNGDIISPSPTGEKFLIRWFRGYLISVTVGGRVGGRASLTGQSGSSDAMTLTIYDITNQFIGESTSVKGMSLKFNVKNFGLSIFAEGNPLLCVVRSRLDTPGVVNVDLLVCMHFKFLVFNFYSSTVGGGGGVVAWKWLNFV